MATNRTHKTAEISFEVSKSLEEASVTTFGLIQGYLLGIFGSNDGYSFGQPTEAEVITQYSKVNSGRLRLFVFTTVLLTL